MSYQLMRAPSAFKVLVKRIAKYEVDAEDGKAIVRATPPLTLFARAMLHSSAILGHGAKS